MYTTDLRLSASEWNAGWRREAGHLLFVLPISPKLGERIAIRVYLTDRPVHATVVGTVASLHRQGEQHRVELSPDADSLPAVRLLRASALGQSFNFSQRNVRYLTRLPVLITHSGGDLYATTVSISKGGCALKWPGPLPDTGRPLRLRFGAGRRAVELDGVVCWVQPGGSAGIAGVRFEGAAGAAAMAGLLLEAHQSGAPET